MSKETGVIPMGADHPQVLHALVRKYAEVSGQIGQARLVVQRLTTNLEHIEAAIRMFDPSIDIGRIRAKRVSIRDPAAKGEVTSVILDALRDSERPLTPRELTEHLMAKRGLPVDDRELFTIMLKRVRACLRAQRVRGVIRPTSLEGAAQGWAITE